MSQQLVALEKIERKPQDGAKWNNHVIIWRIFSNNKNYQIQLEMTYLSSKKVVKVNGESRHTAMVTFGYESSFMIDQGLEGRIKQNGIKYDFELFINDRSFSQIQKKRPTYQPLSMGFNHYEQQQQKVRVKKVAQPPATQNKSNISNSQPNNAMNNSPQPLKGSDIKFEIKKQEVSQIEQIKNTQKELMRILKASKAQSKKG